MLNGGTTTSSSFFSSVGVIGVVISDCSPEPTSALAKVCEDSEFKLFAEGVLSPPPPPQAARVSATPTRRVGTRVSFCNMGTFWSRYR